MKKQKAEPANQAALLAELDLHKAEFTALRQEILQLLESERQYLNLSLVAFGAGLGLTPFISNQETYVILLLFPLVFHVLLWEMLKSTESIGHIVAYLMTSLIPRVNTILFELGIENRNAGVWRWEEYLHLRPLKVTRIIALSFMPTRHWVPILSVGALLGVYALIIGNNNYSPSNSELALVTINLLLLIWAGIQNALIARAFRRIVKKDDL